MKDILEHSILQTERENNFIVSDEMYLYEHNKKLETKSVCPLTQQVRYYKLIPEEDTYFEIKEKFSPYFHFSYPSKTFKFLCVTERHLRCEYSEIDEVFSFISKGVCLFIYTKEGYILEYDERINHILPDYIQDITEEEILYVKLNELI